MRKTLYIIRGLSGSGKTTLARLLTDCRHSADDFFYEAGGGEYLFNHRLLKQAHSQCQDRVNRDLERGVPIVAVANTFSQRWEADPYFEMADRHGYSVSVIECQSSFGSVHDVPQEVIDRMADRWESIT